MKTQKHIIWGALLFFGLLTCCISCSTDEGGTNEPPSIDTDGDGIADADDDCPTQMGPSSNQGCPITATL